MSISGFSKTSAIVLYVVDYSLYVHCTKNAALTPCAHYDRALYSSLLEESSDNGMVIIEKRA